MVTLWRSRAASIAELFDLKWRKLVSYDNHSCIKLSVNPMYPDKSKNIKIKYHYVWDMVQKRAVRLQYITTDEQVANVLTKHLSRVKLSSISETSLK